MDITVTSVAGHLSILCSSKIRNEPICDLLNMDETSRCLQCDAPRIGQAVGGLCANCLLKLALEAPPDPTEMPDESVNRSAGGQAPAENAGSHIGRFRLLEKIGEGGFGTVWMAEQSDPVQRVVALKIIRIGMHTREFIARFEQERQALALMDHPGIAKVFDAGTTDNGRPFFVMELVQGVPITKFCDGKKLPIAGRLELFIEVCRAVQHAHQKGIIHRDIKPSNVMVTLDGDRPVPKIIDFGIAKATQGKLTDETVFTRAEQFIGTPVYMSPEQAGMLPDIDTRSDIYALGVLLYELLTGKPPFDPKSLVAAGHDEMRRIIREVEPPKPSSRLSTLSAGERTALANSRRLESAKLNRSVAPDLDWIVMKAIDKDRARRYETVNGLASDVQRFLADEPVSATPPSAVYKFKKFARRNRAAVTAAAAIAVVLIAATIVSTWQAVRARAAEGLAGERLAEKDEALEEANDVVRFMDEMLRTSDPSPDGKAITFAEVLAAAAKKLETGLDDGPFDRMRAVIANAYLNQGFYREAIPLFEQVVEYRAAAIERYGPEHPVTLDAMRALSNAYREAGRTSEALVLRDKLLVFSRRVNGPEHPDTLAFMNILTNSLFDVGRRREALEIQEESLRLCCKVLGREHPTTLQAMFGLATYYYDAGRRVEALALLEELLPLYRRNSDPEGSDTLQVMSSLARSYLDAGRREDALKINEEVLTHRRNVTGPEHETTIRAMRNLAASYADAGRREEAQGLQQEAWQLGLKVSGEEHPATFAAMGELASFYAVVGRLDEALIWREKALALSRKLNGLDHPSTLLALHNLALSNLEAGQTAIAIRLQEEALSIGRKTDRAEHPDTISVMSGLAISYAAEGRAPEALLMQEQALTLSRKVLGLEHPDTLAAMGALAGILFSDGRLEEALTRGEELLASCRKALGPQHDVTCATMHNLGVFLRAAGRANEALGYQEEVLKLTRKRSGDLAPETLEAMNNIANSYWDAGLSAKSIQMHEDVVRISRQVNGPEHRFTIGAIYNLAQSYSDTNRPGEAIRFGQDAVAFYTRVDGPQHPRTLAAMTNLAVFFDRAGRSGEASALREELADKANPTPPAPAPAKETDIAVEPEP